MASDDPNTAWHTHMHISLVLTEGGRRVPRLEFRRNELTDEQQALEEEFEKMKQDS